MESSFCSFCKSDKTSQCYPTKDIFGDKYYIYHCQSCNAYYLWPLPTPEQLRKAYDSSYYGDQKEKFDGFIENFIDYFRQRRAKRLANQLKNGSSILDIGCGNGRFLQHTLKYGNFNINGIEMEGNSAARASRISNLNLKIGTLPEIDFSKEQFDAISMFHVFEHVANAKEYLKIISEIIKPNGIFVISIPNIASFQSKIFKGKWLHLDPPRHLIYFDAKTLIRIVESHGFTYKKSYYFSIEQNPYGMIQSILNSLCKNREVLFERLKGNTNYAPSYGRLNIMLQKIFFVSSFPLFIFIDLALCIFKVNATFELHFVKSAKLKTN